MSESFKTKLINNRNIGTAIMVLSKLSLENTPGLHTHNPRGTLHWLSTASETAKAPTLIHSASSKALFKSPFFKNLFNNFETARSLHFQSIKRSFLPRILMVQSLRVSSLHFSHKMVPTHIFLLRHPTSLSASNLSSKTPMPDPPVP